MNKRGQSDIIAFIPVVIGILIIAAPILLLANSILGEFATQINTTSEQAGAEVQNIHNTFISFWDYLIAIAFLVNVLMLFVFAFMVDSHPIFSLFYFISSIITLMFAEYVLAPVTVMFSMPSFATEVLQLPITGFIVNQFTLILLGVIVVTGIIMYGKFKGGGLER